MQNKRQQQRIAKNSCKSIALTFGFNSHFSGLFFVVAVSFSLFCILLSFFGFFVECKNVVFSSIFFNPLHKDHDDDCDCERGRTWRRVQYVTNDSFEGAMHLIFLGMYGCVVCLCVSRNIIIRRLCLCVCVLW